jgi:hypothetical protein
VGEHVEAVLLETMPGGGHETQILEAAAREDYDSRFLRLGASVGGGHRDRFVKGGRDFTAWPCCCEVVVDVAD